MDVTSLLKTSPTLINTRQVETPSIIDVPRPVQRTVVESRFESAIKDALKEVNQVHLESDEAVRRLASGEDVDLHGTMIAAEKAEVATKLTAQVRNKALEAYQEIMRMQV